MKPKIEICKKCDHLKLLDENDRRWKMLNKQQLGIFHGKQYCELNWQDSTLSNEQCFLEFKADLPKDCSFMLEQLLFSV